MRFFTLKNCFVFIIAAFVLVRPGTPARAAEPTDEISLGPKSVWRFATPKESADALASHDDYLSRLTLRDRQIRMRKSGDITNDDFARFLAVEALSWQPDQIEKLRPILTSLADRIKPLNLPLPEAVLLGLTTGREEDNAAYTRGHTIFLPQSKVRGSATGLERLLAHELFHVLSRENRDLRQRLYALVGFKPCGEIALPEELATRSLHNPDAPVCDHYIELKDGAETIAAVPVLFAAPERPGAAPTSLFRALEFKLLAIEERDGRWQPQLKDGQPILIDPERNESYRRQIGRNTNYIIHPEEILADNFMHLVFGTKNLPNPELIEKLRLELTRTPSN